jgi:hypothetical protein
MRFAYLLSLIVLTGCVTDGSVYYNISNRDCTLQCSNLMHKYICSYSYTKETNYCECLMFECFKKAPMEDRPWNFSGYVVTSEVFRTARCYENGAETNCSGW